MKNKVQKAYEITDAKISFVSLVDKAANKKQFLITKAEEGKANFATYGRILKVDSDHHYVTGVVYEPLVADAHDNYMTEEEIIKAAYYFAKNGDSVDLQHSFEALEDATIVENWVTKSDTIIGEEEIKKGTWLITVEITDTDVWEQIEKGDITGFSMGGIGKYSDEDTEVEKGAGKVAKEDTPENKSILKKLAEMFGLDVVEKGAFNDEYNKRKKANNFWSAFYTLQDMLATYSWYEEGYKFESDETTITEALQEFSTAITEILTMQDIAKALTGSEKLIEKAGKKMSSKNKSSLDEIVQSLNNFAKEFDENEEDDEVKKEDVQKMIEEGIKKSFEAKLAETQPQVPDAKLTAEAVEKMITDSITKALATGNVEAKQEDNNLTADKVQEMITKAIEPILKQKGLPSNLNNLQSEGTEIQKSAGYMSHIINA